MKIRKKYRETVHVVKKQTKYVNEVTNSENRIKTKWKFCTKKTLRSRAQNDNITSSKRTQKQKTIKNERRNLKC